jgi:diaminopropionate ammonia-lyase
MFLLNTLAQHGAPLTASERALLGAQGAAESRRVLKARGAAAATPLHDLKALATALGVGQILVKDEGQRLGLGSFKALGGAFAVTKLVEAAATSSGGGGLNDGAMRIAAAEMVFACATDGNHGRSVAEGAHRLGARSVVFVHAGVSQERADAIARFGAEIVRVSGGYDDSVREASRVAAAKGWTVVSDTSWPGYEDIPGLVMQGYTALVAEALETMTRPPTHVFMQAGVGGLAAAAAAHFAAELGDARPQFIVVEPQEAACLFRSAEAGRPVAVAPGRPTVMAMLECHEPSLLAWGVLERLADAFMTIDDEDAVAVMNMLARPKGADPEVVAGESGGVGLAGLVRALSHPELKAALGLESSSRIFLVNSEAATDPGLYESLVGVKAQTLGGAHTPLLRP